jgi:hypothetical protein
MASQDFSQLEDCVEKLQIEIQNVSPFNPADHASSAARLNGLKDHQTYTASVSLCYGNPLYALLSSPTTGKTMVLSPRFFKIL